MNASNYELTDSVAGFDEGDVLDVTARFGDWHTYALKLEPASGSRRTVVVTQSEAGFSEAEILDPTARIGDWQEYDLKFDPGRPEKKERTAARVELTMDELEAVAKPVDASA